MPNSVIYHGASNGNGPWPSTAGGYVPSASMLHRERLIDASLFALNKSQGQDNPPRFEFHNFGPGTAQWFSRVIAFPPAGTGGSWAQMSFNVPANADISLGTMDFQIFWSTGAGIPSGNTDWHIHYTIENPGFAIQGGGPGTVFSQLGVTNELMYTPVLPIAPTRGGVPVPLVAGRVGNLNVYRGDNDATLYSAYLLGVLVSYHIMP